MLLSKTMRRCCDERICNNYDTCGSWIDRPDGYYFNQPSKTKKEGVMILINDAFLLAILI